MLNLKQAADRAGYSEPGFRKLLAKGRGPRFSRAARKGHYRFRPEWVDEWQERDASPQAKPPKPKGLLRA
jgi:hypothetical protein